jgi:TolA-binding protein
VPITSVRPRARASHPADATATVARKESRDEDEARNAEDAEYVRIIALLKESRIAEARALSEDYLRRFPDGFRRKEVEGVARR